MESALTTRVGNRVTRLMRRHHLTQRDLAENAGVGEYTVCRILRGYDVRLTTLEKIAKALDTDVASLISEHAA